MTIEDLSPELILEVLTYLDRSSLWSFYTCSHRFYYITQLPIYSTFTQTGQHALPNLLRSVIAKPYLATFIKHLNLSILGRRHSISDIDTSFLTEIDRNWIRAQLLNAGWSKEWVQDWFARLSEKDNWDAAAGLLIYLCSKNLETLILRGGKNVETHTIRSTLEFAADEPSYFPKLRSISLSSKAPKYIADQLIPLQRTSAELISSALKLTDIKELHFEGLYSVDEALVLSHPSLAAKKLSFTKCQVDARLLENFLLRFNSLTHFKYEAECYHISGLHLISTHIKRALQHSRHTLTHLSLDPGDEWYQMGPGSNPNDPVLGDMRSFSALKYLEVDGLMLLGEETESPLSPDPRRPFKTDEYYTTAQCETFAHGFPESFETLVIHRCADSILGPVAELLNSGVPKGLKHMVRASFGIGFDRRAELM